QSSHVPVSCCVVTARRVPTMEYARLGSTFCQRYGQFGGVGVDDLAGKRNSKCLVARDLSEVARGVTRIAGRPLTARKRPEPSRRAVADRRSAARDGVRGD